MSLVFWVRFQGAANPENPGPSTKTPSRPRMLSRVWHCALAVGQMLGLHGGAVLYCAVCGCCFVCALVCAHRGAKKAGKGCLILRASSVRALDVPCLTEGKAGLK